MLRVIGVLLLIPILDVLLLVVLTGFLGWKLILALVVLTALVGMLLVRAEGRHTIRKLQRKTAQGEVPTDELVDAGLLLVAGGFLLTPGLVTDALGFILAVPFTRWPVRWAVKRWIVTPYIDAKTGGFVSGNVYVGGFPGGDEGDGPVGPGPVGDGDGGGPGGSGGNRGPGSTGGRVGTAQTGADETVDLDEDAYEVDLDEDEGGR